MASSTSGQVYHVPNSLVTYPNQRVSATAQPYTEAVSSGSTPPSVYYPYGQMPDFFPMAFPPYMLPYGHMMPPASIFPPPVAAAAANVASQTLGVSASPPPGLSEIPSEVATKKARTEFPIVLEPREVAFFNEKIKTLPQIANQIVVGRDEQRTILPQNTPGEICTMRFLNQQYIVLPVVAEDRLLTSIVVCISQTENILVTWKESLALNLDGKKEVFNLKKVLGKKAGAIVDSITKLCKGASIPGVRLVKEEEMMFFRDEKKQNASVLKERDPSQTTATLPSSHTPIMATASITTTELKSLSSIPEEPLAEEAAAQTKAKRKTRGVLAAENRDLRAIIADLEKTNLQLIGETEKLRNEANEAHTVNSNLKKKIVCMRSSLTQTEYQNGSLHARMKHIISHQRKGA